MSASRTWTVLQTESGGKKTVKAAVQLRLIGSSTNLATCNVTLTAETGAGSPT